MQRRSENALFCTNSIRRKQKQLTAAGQKTENCQSIRSRIKADKVRILNKFGFWRKTSALWDVAGINITV